MKAPACPNCPRADLVWNHPHYTRGCAQCDLRRLAFSKAPFRMAAFDHLEKAGLGHKVGTLRDKLEAEMERIKYLKGNT